MATPATAIAAGINLVRSNFAAMLDALGNALILETRIASAIIATKTQ